MFSIIVATDISNGIGLCNDGCYYMPWYCEEDMKFFKKLTSGQNIIMGRNTFLSLNETPLINRLNIVITSNTELMKRTDILCYRSLDEALNFCYTTKKETYVIGGSQLYTEALTNYTLKHIYWNIIKNSHIPCNIHFPIALEVAKTMYNINNIVETDDVIYHKLSIKN